MKSIIMLPLLWTLCPAQPGIVWERTYFPGTTCSFLDVHETSNGGFIVAGLRNGGAFPDACLFRFSPTGDLVWEVSEPWDYQKTQWVEELPDGEGFIATGVCRVNPDDSYAFCLVRVNADGNLEWSRVLDVENSTEYGTCVLPLPDDGYAVTAYRSSTDLGRQAWILRTDSQGDTLWTREWGWEYSDEARRVLLVDGALTVLMQGRLQTTSYGPHLVRYDLDGNLLWETPIPELYGYVYRGQDMCYSPADGGYFVLTHHGPWLAHTDSLGVLQWLVPGRGASNPLGYSINTTMDQGIIYAGQSTPDPDIPGTTYSGMIVRYDSSGNEVWWDYVYNSDCEGLFSARQLSSGGYIACGIAGSSLNGPGYLIRYEPELGIDEPGCSSAATLSLHPTPFNSILSISYHLSDLGPMMLSVFDLTGRMVEKLESGVRPAGGNTVLWSPGPECPAGCYLVVLDACGERLVARCAKLD